MFGSDDTKKRKLEAAYGKGMEKARQTGAVQGLTDAMASLVLPDSMGTEEYQSYRAGYNDYISSNDAKPRPTAPTALDPSEKAWYGLCNSTDFIPDELVDYYKAALFARGNQAAFVVGLSKFTSHECPRCGVKGQFRVHFLGHLRHPSCGWDGYMGTGSYVGFQFAQTIHSGVRAGGSVKEDADNKGEKHTWVTGLFAFLSVGVLRAAAAVVLIPLHCVAALFHPDQTKSDVATRVITLAIIATSIGLGAYEIQSAYTSKTFSDHPGPAPMRQSVIEPPQPTPAASLPPTSQEDVSAQPPPPEPIAVEEVSQQSGQYEIKLLGCRVKIGLDIPSRDAYFGVCTYTITALQSDSAITSCGNTATFSVGDNTKSVTDTFASIVDRSGWAHLTNISVNVPINVTTSIMIDQPTVRTFSQFDLCVTENVYTHADFVASFRDVALR
jgi:hypothetical protein